jgi:hypothetical protein
MKVVPLHNEAPCHEDIWGHRGIALPILGTKWRCVDLGTSLNVVAKKDSCPCWELNPGCPAPDLVTILTELRSEICCVI